MALQESTLNAQRALAQFVRTGSEDVVIPDAHPRHVRQYRELVRNVIESSLSSAFPLTEELFSQAQWDTVVDEFIALHNAQSNEIWRLPEEFVSFAREQNYAQRFGYTFLDELLVFEWLEIEVFMMPDADWQPGPMPAAPLAEPLSVNPEHRMGAYHYPLHNTAPLELPNAEPGEYYLLLYRDPHELVVEFMELSPLYVLLLEQLQQGNTAEAVLPVAAEIFGISDMATLEAKAGEFLADMGQRGMLKSASA